MSNEIDEITDFQQAIYKEFPELLCFELSYFVNARVIRLDSIVVKFQHRNKGIATKVLDLLNTFSDLLGIVLMLEISETFGSDGFRLYDFYCKSGYRMTRKPTELIFFT